jgi:hypothetical protein
MKLNLQLPKNTRNPGKIKIGTNVPRDATPQEDTESGEKPQESTYPLPLPLIRGRRLTLLSRPQNWKNKVDIPPALNMGSQ